MKNFRLAIVISLWILSGSSLLYAQSTIRVKEAKGECPIVNISPEKAKETALFYAKADALKKAGIPEYITAIETLLADDKGGQQFKAVSNIELGGSVINFEIMKDDIEVMQVGPSKIMVATVLINAEVLKYNKTRDPAFQFKVDGIEAYYKEKQNLEFLFTPYKQGYLRIFLFEEDESGAQIFPDEAIELDRVFIANKPIAFPTNGTYSYRLFRTDNKKAYEMNKIIFIFLKDDVQFLERDVTLQSVLNWIAKISPDQRTEMFYQFAITGSK
jgi:hypothetical protein